MFIEHAVAPPNGGPAVAERIPGEANTGSRIHNVGTLAAAGDAVGTALHQAVGYDRIQVIDVERDGVQIGILEKSLVRVNKIKQNVILPS